MRRFLLDAVLLSLLAAAVWLLTGYLGAAPPHPQAAAAAALAIGQAPAVAADPFVPRSGVKTTNKGKRCGCAAGYFCACKTHCACKNCRHKNCPGKRPKVKTRPAALRFAMPQRSGGC